MAGLSLLMSLSGIGILSNLEASSSNIELSTAFRMCLPELIMTTPIRCWNGVARPKRANTKARVDSSSNVWGRRRGSFSRFLLASDSTLVYCACSFLLTELVAFTVDSHFCQGRSPNPTPPLAIWHFFLLKLSD